VQFSAFHSDKTVMAQRYTRSYAAGSYIFREGDKGDCAFIVEKGQVQIAINNNGESVPVAALKKGDLFGEMAIIDGLPRSASAYAIEDCELSVISESLLNERISGSDPIVQLLVSLLIQRLRSVNKKFKGHVVENEDALVSKPLVLDEAHRRLKLENDLMQGLAREEFFLEYQGIYNLASRDLIGFEALVRWRSSERGIVPPNSFIDVAEETSMIIPLGEWILKKGFEDLQILQGALGDSELMMSLNVSARQLNDPLFFQRLQKLQKSTSVNPKHIKLEITERVFQEGEFILKTIDQVIEQGFSFAVDDFGTGYSSLTSLLKMKASTVKIDRSFVSTLTKDPRSKAIIQAIVGMASEMGLLVVAEGIEHDDEALLLGALGCQSAQGYLFARPKSLEQLIRELGVFKIAA
jgi:EAL domain-containing protein (putative c-di-GMP-specific phosphodiesterase class I)